ncbi:MAG TPA: ABC transporter transmembrane domain-containing protein, partial [Bacilli bacterium]|nr:ABC transporter transmembrane domain-containing protein [Bacilli bacterium]
MIRRFIKYYRPHWRLLVLDLFCALAVAGIDLLFPVATNRILRELIPNSQIRTMLLVGFFLLVLYGIRFLFSYIIGYYGHVMGIRIETDMRSDLFRKLQVLDYQFFDNKKTGELMTNLTSHLHDVSEMSHHAPEDLFISSLMLMGSFTILMFIEPLLTLIVFVFLLM